MIGAELVASQGAPEVFSKSARRSNLYSLRRLEHPALGRPLSPSPPHLTPHTHTHPVPAVCP